MMGEWHDGWWLVVLPMMIIMCVLMVAWMISMHRPPASRPAVEAERILAGRYARGEIDSVAYRQQLDELRR